VKRKHDVEFTERSKNGFLVTSLLQKYSVEIIFDYVDSKRTEDFEDLRLVNDKDPKDAMTV